MRVDLGKFSLESVRYAAYAVSDRAFVHVAAAGKLAAVTLAPKNGGAAGRLKERFLEELEDERLREAVSDANRELREFLTLKALSGRKEREPEADSALTPAQEKELADLIAQVEKEIKEEAGSGDADPLDVTRTWEDKYGAEKPRKKR